MKTNRKPLAFNKIKIARVNSYAIIGRGTTVPNTVFPECAPEESRTPKGGRTQSTEDTNDCA
ncbi:hypothetical protein C8N46_102439 [Kordia periserrulae]|uniref:Uncharacterized protein n=1 Tax=Kordia periserrulae TaxID=701523 RepID=A0A2T6C402_9FLAO|nr:hypothetical protein [Kordia periserrulae]PTX63038.1 hypothetical protein C8N46_102439 [Kordia periserrulae]